MAFIRLVCILALLATSTVAGGAAHADPSNQPGCGADEYPLVSGPEACFGWQGEWRRFDVEVPSRLEGVVYEGVMHAPVKVGTDRPVVVIQHGYQGSTSNINWAQRDLAAHGYVTIAVTSPSSGETGTAEAFAVAVRSALDFLEDKKANPLYREVDLGTIGAAGHSQGALAVAYAQGVDKRIDTIVAWDNLASDLTGDAGSAINCHESGLGVPTRFEETPIPITPRVPAFGHAQDLPCVRAPDQLDPEAKKAGYRVWRDAGVEALLVSFAGYDHFDWSQSFADTAKTLVRGEEQAAGRYEYLSRLTRMWFDHFLRGKKSVRKLLDLMPADVRSTRWTSAAFVGGIDCEDLNACKL